MFSTGLSTGHPEDEGDMRKSRATTYGPAAQLVGPTTTTTEDSTVCRTRFTEDFPHSRENLDMGFCAGGL